MNIIHQAAIFVLQLSFILIVAKIFGEIAVRYFKQPAVLGELLAGVLISPFAFGGHLIIPGNGPLFPLAEGFTTVPVSDSLFIVAELAAVILLFMAGLETNLKLFLKYAGPALLIAIGGVAVPFVLGDYLTVAFGFAKSWFDPSALFVGAIMTATSVGITARILGEIKKLDTPEGVTVLAAAVVDDVLGILVLSIVIAVVKIETSGGSFSLSEIGIIGVKAVVFWVGLLVVGMLIAGPLEKLISKFKSSGARVAIILSFCFAASYLSEAVGLAMIIGAYGMGLAFSKMKSSKELIKEIEPIFHFLVPVFFVVTGMMVNIGAFNNVIIFGLIITLAAIFGKLFGCGIPSAFLGFNGIGSLRISVGMIPRGEVALIIAMVGLSSGIIDQKIYGVSIMMTLVTTLIAPIALSPLFRIAKQGRKGGVDQTLLKEIEKVAEEEIER